MSLSRSAIAESHIFNIVMVILLWPWALLTSNDLIVLLMTPFSTLTDDSLVFVTQYRVSGILLLLLKGIHCDAKKIIRTTRLS